MDPVGATGCRSWHPQVSTVGKVHPLKRTDLPAPSVTIQIPKSLAYLKFAYAIYICCNFVSYVYSYALRWIAGSLWAVPFDAFEFA